VRGCRKNARHFVPSRKGDVQERVPHKEISQVGKQTQKKISTMYKKAVTDSKKAGATSFGGLRKKGGKKPPAGRTNKPKLEIQARLLGGTDLEKIRPRPAGVLTGGDIRKRKNNQLKKSPA